jgi:hypothetical protein
MYFDTEFVVAGDWVLSYCNNHSVEAGEIVLMYFFFVLIR